MMTLKNHIDVSIYRAFFALLIFYGCRGTEKNEKPLSTPTSGEINIVADETLKPVVDAEIDVFEALYKDAEIDVEYVSEVTAMNKFLRDSAILAVLTRSLTEKEISVVKNQKIDPSKYHFAIGAIALIINKNNPDSLISMEQIQSIFKGKIEQWGQMNPNSSLGQIQIIFGNQNASTVRFIKDSIASGELPPNTFAVASNNGVIDYVSKNENALGIIGVSWISDKDDPQALGFLDKIRVMAVSGGSSGEFYKPYQAYIAQGLYPLNRKIYMVSREPRAGLATGFMSFVASSKGQRVILKLGLVPATMPVRIIQFKEQKEQ